MADIYLVIKIPEQIKQAFDKAESNDLKGGYYDLTDGIETHEPTKAENQRAKKRKEDRYTDLTPHTVIIHREGTPTYNIQCHNYGEYRDRNNKVIERTCTVGMDMCYCSKKCAYATNNVCSLKG